MERLEDRRLLTVATPTLGASNDVVFSGDGDVDSIQFRVSGSGSGGLLYHNLGGRFGFNSGLDLDSITPGDQTRLVSDLTSLSYNDSGKNDTVIFETSEVFAFAATNVSINAGTISVKTNATISSDDGVISLIAERNISLASGSSLTTVDGGISLSANATGTAVGDFNGLETLGSTIQTTGTGNISLIGGGGDDPSTGSHYGVYFNSGTSLSSTSNGANAGTITIDGTGGDGASNSRGVLFTATGTGPTSGLPKVSVTSVNGDISITGQSGNGAGNGNWGIQLSSVETISSTGTGVDAAKITIDGTGGTGEANNLGVYLAGSTTDITSVDGNITLIGQGGGSETGQGNNPGVSTYSFGGISSTGTGANAATISIIGTGGVGYSSNAGISLRSGIEIESADGAITISGQGGNGGGRDNKGVYFDGNTTMSSMGTGLNAATITVLGTGGDGGQFAYGTHLFATLTSVDGNISITGQGGNGSTKGGNSGVIMGSAASSTGTGADAATITINGTGGTGTSSNLGVSLGGPVTSVDGAISVNGTGGNGSSSGNDGVLLDSVLTSTGTGAEAATITIDGTGGSGGGSGLHAVDSTRLTSIDGAISLTGQGGNGSFGANHGVNLVDVETITSTGVGTNAATITIHGDGGTSNTGSHGVLISGTSRTNIHSFVGDIAITGTGGTGDLDLSTSTSRGLYLTNVEIASLGTAQNATGVPATIAIEGTGGNARRQNDGTYIEQSVVTSVLGNIDIRGEAGTASASDTGVRALNTELTSTGEGAQAATISMSSESGVSASISLATIDGNASFLGLNGSVSSTSGTITSTRLGKLAFDGGDVFVGGDISSEFTDIVVGGASVYQTSGQIQSTGTGPDAAKLLIGDESTHSIRLNGDLSSFNGDIEIANQITDASTGVGYVWIYGDITSTGTVKADAAKITIDGTGADGQTGVYFRGSDQVVSSEVGDISITGRGGESTGNSSRGVWLQNVTKILSTGTDSDAAQIGIHGTGGAGVNNNTGVYFDGDNAGEISSVIGAISITGTGGAGTGSTNAGVYVIDASISSTGSSTIDPVLDAATITINGTGGGGASGNDGVTFVTSAISSRDGAVLLNGTGGVVGQGVYVNFSSITSSGEGNEAATITIDGTAGLGTNGSGAYLTRPTITSGDGAISITGRGREGRTTGVDLDNAIISSTGIGENAATIDLIGIGGDGVSLNNGIEIDGSTAITSFDGNIAIDGTAGNNSNSSGTMIRAFDTIASLGTSPDAAQITIDGSTPELGSNGVVFAIGGGQRLITSNYGDISITGQANGIGVYSVYSQIGTPWQIVSAGQGANAANIRVEGHSGSQGIGLTHDASHITTIDGDISISGSGTAGTSIDGVVSSSGTGSEAGNISILGTGSSYNGAIIRGAVTTTDGNIIVTGTAGDLRSFDRGVTISGTVSSIGVGADAGLITITGTAAAEGADGVYFADSSGTSSGTSVTSVDGDVEITGTAGGGTGSGVYLQRGVSSTGTDKPFAANVSIAGTGGISDGIGVQFLGGNDVSPHLSTVAGDVKITGTGGSGSGSGNRGVWFRNAYVESTGATTGNAGKISVNGTGGSGGASDLVGVELESSTSHLVSVAGDIEIIATAGIGSGINNVGLQLADTSVIGDAGTTGDITIRTNSIDLQAGVIQSTGALTIEPKTDSTTIGIGGGGGELNLDDAELTRLADGFSFVAIGNATAGMIDIDTATFTDNVIIAGEKINDHAGSDIDAGSNTVSLVGTISPGQSPGILQLTGEIQLADAAVLEIEINGLSAGESAADHDQVNVVGTLAIGAGVELRTATTNGFDPTLGQQLVIVENDGTDPIIGVFDGLPEGTILTDFLGAALDARISYLGLDETTGNDVVLTIVEGNLAPLADAGGPYSIEEGDPLALDASGSSDPDDDTLSYAWDLNDDGDFSDATGVTPSLSWAELVALGVGDVAQFDVTLSVDDGRATAVTDSVTVIVLLNSPPTADAGGSYFVDEGRSVTLDARGTTDDKGIGNLVVDWDLDGDGDFGETGVGAERGDETGLQPVFSAALVDGPQNFGVQLRVVDDRGMVDIDSTIVSVRNVAPTLSLDSAITIDRGDTWMLDGSFVDPGPDAWTATVNYADGSGDQALLLDGKEFVLSHDYSTAGAYTVVVTIDDGDGGVSENVTVIVELPPLADLTLISADVSFDPINPDVGDAVNFVVDVTNKGTIAAANVPVSVQVYDATSESFVEIGRSMIASINANPEGLDTIPDGRLSLTWDGMGSQPALPSEAAYLLVRVVVDPDSTTEELDESNNEAIQVLQVGSPDFGSAALVANVSPFAAHRGEYVAVGGQAFYDFSTVPGNNDFPVQNASMTARLIDPATGEVLRASGGRTAINGNFLDTFRSPETDGVYTLRFEISDGTLSSVFETTLTVSGEAPVVTPRPRGPAGPGYVFSSSIEFTQPALPPGNPQIGVPVTIIGSFLYELDQPLTDVPVTFNDLFPVVGQLQTFEIGNGFVRFPDGGLAEPAVLPIEWTPTAEGYHIIEVVAEPDFNFRSHSNTTRLLLVGDLDTTSLSVEYDSSIVPDPEPAFAMRGFAPSGFAAASAFSAPLAMAASEVPAPGDTLSFTLSYENTGTTTITGGMLIDDFDETLMGTPTNISDGGVVDGSIVRWDLGEIAPGTSGTVSYEVTINSAAEFPPGSTYLFNTAILNADQAVAAGTSELTLSNNAPVITGLNLSQELDENGDVTLSGTFSDASTSDTHTVRIDWGDGESETLMFNSGERSFSSGHTYGVDHAALIATYDVAISVTDQTGQQVTASVTTQVPEDQITPLSMTDSYGVDQAATLSVSVGESVLANDTAATSEPLHALLVTAPQHATSFTLNADGTFTYTPQTDFRGIDQFVYVAQSSGQPSELTAAEINVRNLAATIDTAVISGLGEQAVAGETLSLSGTFFDAGTILAHAGTVDWGDGSGPQTLSVVFDSGSGSFSATHVYANPGTYTATVTLSDGDLETTELIETTVIEVVSTETGVRVDQGELQITGTDDDDFVSVSSRGSRVYVAASFLTTNRRWGLGSVSFPLSDVQSIHADMGAGNDVFRASAWLDLPMIIEGGEGNDVLSAGGGASLIFGGAGNDLLVGGRGRSILVGGTGRDRLIGGRNDDVLIGGEIQAIDGNLSGETLHDQIMSVWNSDDSYADRTDALTALVDDVDDNERDLLFGLSGRDLYFDSLGDRLLGVRRWGSEAESTR